MRIPSLLAVLLAWPSIGLANESIAIDQRKLAACLGMRGGKERLFCYREASGQVPPVVKHYPKASIDACRQERFGLEELTCLDKLFKYPKPGSLEP